MGFLNFFSSRKNGGGLGRLPSGSFTVDRQGRVIASTLSQSFPESRVREIAQAVLGTFRHAREIQIPLHELVVDYAAVKLTARELRGGAMIFLTPTGMSSSASQPAHS